MTEAADHPSIASLARIGRLLDEAIDVADAAGEALVGAQIAQALHLLDTRLAALRVDPFPHDHGRAGPSDGGVVQG